MQIFCVCVLSSRLRSQQGFLWSKYDSFYYIFWTVDSLRTKLDLMIYIIIRQSVLWKKRITAFKDKVKAEGQNVDVCPNECNQSGCGVDHLGYAKSVHLLDVLWWPKVFANTRSLKVANSRSLSLLICVDIAEPVFTSILAHFCIPVSVHNKNVLLRCLINDIL